MLLESDLRPLITASLLCLTLSLSGGCDRESAPKEQPRTPEIAATPQAQPQKGGSMGLESANGLRATLTYAYRGRRAPAAAFTGADGRDVSLSDYAGRPLLVNLWATWCAPCKAEMPTLDALAQLEEGRVSVIAVSQDLQGRKPVNAFFTAAQIGNLEPFTDRDNALLGAIGGNPALPVTILYDADGKEVWRVIGGLEWDDAEVSKLLAEAS
ncbi:MAG: TlpA family protein disulfide reductase [Sphingomonadales bacterium]|nr:TlpA family protein disulfide reductase [Sphingomonadales bacterium]